MTARNILMATAGGSVDANYIEDVFSTYLYTGNSSTQTITNGIDLAGKGGLVWIKSRNSVNNHRLVDSARGNYNTLITSNTAAQYDSSPVGPTLASTGFTVGNWSEINDTGLNYASWTFRKQPKFFDVVTYTGTGSPRTVAHNLGSVPGCIIIKRLETTGNWIVYHRSNGPTNGIFLNGTSAAFAFSGYWNDTDPTSSVFTVGTSNDVNGPGSTYVAYIFAHNAGGFGLTGTDNVISCGTFTADALEKATVTLGYEPQWLLAKPVSTTGDWLIRDNMRGFPVATDSRSLAPNTSAAETNGGRIFPTATGFAATSNLTANATYIYIAIRRGPMKVPTDGTRVFSPVARTGTGSVASVTTPGFPVDMTMIDDRLGYRTLFFDKLRGANHYITSVNTSAETTYPGNNGVQGFLNTGFILGADTEGYVNFSGDAYINWCFGRAPGFFDEVCYTGTGVATTRAHNLGVVPELMISKRRSGTAEDWSVYHAAMGAAYYMFLNLTNAKAGPNSGPWNSTAPTSSVFSTGDWYESGATYVTYLFASCPGVSKVGSYTGTGTTLQINCGFTAGARFVLIKRTDSTGDWYVWDSARGIVAGNDPYLLLNSTAAEVTNTDYVDPYSAGFEISSTAPAAINASGGTFIYLAIA